MRVLLDRGVRVLLDHCVTRFFAALLKGHDVRTTDQQGWQDASNGKLLALAAREFDVFLTVDRSLANQQNVGELPIAVVVMRCRSNSIDTLAVHVPGVVSLLNQSLQRRVYVLEEPRDDRKAEGDAGARNDPPNAP